LLILIPDNGRLALDDLTPFLFEQLKDAVAFSDLHQGIEEDRVVIAQICPVEFDTSLDDFLYDASFQDCKQFIAPLLE
jgi:hypothetical protein